MGKSVKHGCHLTEKLRSNAVGVRIYIVLQTGNMEAAIHGMLSFKKKKKTGWEHISVGEQSLAWV